ncbi:MAG: hypothetical protein KGH56_02685 [Patescibacteria group bacterium]|nr:hypothetical protein [Patescibacteria group bacterium]
MKIPKLKTVGICTGRCRKEVEVEASPFYRVARDHDFRGKKCSGSDYSVTNARFVIQTQEEALQVAAFLKNDKARCLERPLGGYHAMDCGDGDRCQKTRQKLASAFASYYLANHAKPA